MSSQPRCLQHLLLSAKAVRLNANSSTAFKVLIFKSKEGRRRKRRARPSQACVGGLGLIETPPAKRLESPSSPSPAFLPSSAGTQKKIKLIIIKKSRRQQPKGHPQGAQELRTCTVGHQSSPKPQPSVCVDRPLPSPRWLPHVERCLRDARARAGSFCAVTLPFFFGRQIHTGTVSGTRRRSSLLCQLSCSLQRFLPLRAHDASHPVEMNESEVIDHF